MSRSRIGTLHTLALLAGLVLGLAVSLGGCARHVHHHAPAPKTVVVLEQEHDHVDVEVVHVRPRAGRVCWKHGAHWHCRR